MKRRILLMPGVLGEIRTAKWWYEDQRRGLGDRFERAVEQVFNRLLDDPERFRVVGDDGLRRLNVERFPYHVYFKIDEERLRILVVFHTSRSPRALIERLKGH